VKRETPYLAGMKEHATKQRLLNAGEQLFRTQGYAATGLKELTQAAEAPWGSMYHFFPDGKEQLGAEIVRYAGEFYGAGCQATFDRFVDPAEAVERIFLFEVGVLQSSDYRNGCPIASVTLDTASTSEVLRAAAASAFAGWLQTFARAFIAAGAPEAEAAALASFVLSCLEGAIILARAAKDPAALLHSAPLVRQVIDRAAENWTRLA
jgi:TetR/AcrR family transcriptional repressor of lmrAB and yxaGH operons